jgi:hypothetical protein
MACHTTLPVILNTRVGNSTRTSTLVDYGTLSNYVSLALFRSLSTPITCSHLAPIQAANGHVISPKVEEATVKFHFNQINDVTEECFAVAPLRHSIILRMPWFVQFNP